MFVEFNFIEPDVPVNLGRFKVYHFAQKTGIFNCLDLGIIRKGFDRNSDLVSILFEFSSDAAEFWIKLFSLSEEILEKCLLLKCLKALL